jgi:hypothetical protein
MTTTGKRVNTLKGATEPVWHFQMMYDKQGLYADASGTSSPSAILCSALLGSELTLVAHSGSLWGHRSIRLEERDEAGLVDGPLGSREANQ